MAWWKAAMGNLNSLESFSVEGELAYLIVRQLLCTHADYTVKIRSFIAVYLHFNAASEDVDKSLPLQVLRKLP